MTASAAAAAAKWRREMERSANHMTLAAWHVIATFMCRKLIVTLNIRFTIEIIMAD
jgi:hypothetical protein